MIQSFVVAKIPAVVRENAEARARAAMAKVQGVRGKNKFGNDFKRIMDGFIAEEMFRRLYSGEWADNYESDVVVDGLRYDVKTIHAGERGYPPLMGWRAVVNSCEYGKFIKSKAHRYVFSRMNEDRTEITFTGWLDVDLFDERAKVCRVGEPQYEGGKPCENSDNRYVYNTGLRPMSSIGHPRAESA